MNKKLHLIAATDYSMVSVNACRYALQLAGHLNASLTFIHVYQHPAVLPNLLTERGKIKKYLSDTESKKIEEFRLDRIAEEKSGHTEVETNCFAYEGNVTKEILDEAKRSKADFIITGTHGTSGFRNYIIGSHAWEIIRKSEIPVFAIPQESSFHGFKNIVFGTEYNKDEIPAIRFLSRLAGLSHGHVTVLHIIDKLISADGELTIAQEFQKEITDRAEFSNFELTIVQNEEVAEGLVKYSTDKNADCIVLSNNKSFRVENILPRLFRKAKKLSVSTNVPLLVIPSRYSVLQKKLWELSGLEYYLK